MTQKLDPKILALNAHMVAAILEDCIALGERARIVRAMLTGEKTHVEQNTPIPAQDRKQQAAYAGNSLVYGTQVITYGAQNATAQDVVDRRTGTTVDDLPEREWPQTYGMDVL